MTEKKDKAAQGNRANILLFLVSLLIAFFAVAVSLEFFKPFKIERSRYNRVRNVFQYDRANIVPDPELGYRIRPNLDTVFQSPEIGGFTTRVRTNRLGFRDDDASLEDPEFVFLGDSFAFGWGVEQNETVSARFQALSSKRSLNMAVSGYGTVQQYLLIHRLADILALNGKTVILLLYYNDLEDNVGYGLGVYPRVISPGPPLMTTTSTEVEVERWLETVLSKHFSLEIYQYSHIAYLVGRLIEKLAWVTGLERTPKVQAATETEEEKRALLKLLLGYLSAFLADRDSRLFVCFIPRVTYYTDGESSGFERVQEALQNLGIPYLDSTPLLTREDYWILDGHWKASGHDKVARELERILLER